MTVIYIWESAIDVTYEKDPLLDFTFTKGDARKACQDDADRYESVKPVTRMLSWENIGPSMSRATHPNGYDHYFIAKRRVH